MWVWRDWLCSVGFEKWLGCLRGLLPLEELLWVLTACVDTCVGITCYLPLMTTVFPGDGMACVSRSVVKGNRHLSEMKEC